MVSGFSSFARFSVVGMSNANITDLTDIGSCCVGRVPHSNWKVIHFLQCKKPKRCKSMQVFQSSYKYWENKWCVFGTRQFNLTLHSGAYIMFLAKNIHYYGYFCLEACAHCALELPMYLCSWRLLRIGYLWETVRESWLCKVTSNTRVNKK